MMDKFTPITTLEQLNQLNEMEVIEGYWEGKNKEPEPGGNRGLSCWHGWRNGMMDGKHMPIDEAARKLVKAIVDGKRQQHHDQ